MRILLADDHELVRDTLSAYLAAEDFAEVCHAGTLAGAMHLLSEEGPFDLVLLDYNMPGMSGLHGLAEILRAHPGVPVAILSGTAANSVAQDAVNAGAAGFLPKSMGARSLINAVRFMASGEIFVPPALMHAAAAEQNPAAAQLSRRETEVLSGLCRGMSNKEIALELDLQEVTIKLHVRTLCRKLGARNRTQAALSARDAGLF
ncbi:response regulator transcription factor [Salinihabitans flavidus]|nr:response regulator transcription factor [Salinihabitans flavidus]